MSGTTYFPAAEDTTRVHFYEGDREFEVTSSGLHFEAGSVAAEALVSSGVLKTGNRRKNTSDAVVEASTFPVITPEHHLAVAETNIADPVAALAAAKQLDTDDAPAVVADQAARAAETGGEG
jgi:hypothetical protein